MGCLPQWAVLAGVLVWALIADSVRGQRQTRIGQSSYGSSRRLFQTSTESSDCVDKQRRCRNWARDCTTNPTYMLVNCKKTCGLCDSKVAESALFMQEKKLRTKLMQNYDSPSAPLQNASDSIDVALSFSLLHLLDVDEAKQTFTTQGYLKLKWTDSRLAWEPSSYAEISALSFSCSNIWHPLITVVNTAAAANTYMLRGNPTPIMVSSSGVATWTPRVEVSSLCKMDIKFFPIDVHRCSVVFGPWLQDSTAVNISLWKIDDVDDSENPYTVQNLRWDVKTWLQHDEDYISPCCGEPWPVMKVEFEIKRHAPMMSAAVIVPVVSVVVTLFLCFLLPIRSVVRFIFASGDGVILLVFLLYLSRVTPEASSSSPLIVQITVALILESLLILMWCGLLYHLSSPRGIRFRIPAIPVKLSFINKVLSRTPTKPDASASTYTCFQNPSPDLVDMLFGAEDELLLPESQEVTGTNGIFEAHAVPKPPGANGTTTTTQVTEKTNGDQLVTEAQKARNFLRMLNLLGLIVFTAIFVIQTVTVMML